jgi:hypothetical protein
MNKGAQMFDVQAYNAASLSEKVAMVEKTKIGYVIIDRQSDRIVRKYNKPEAGPAARRAVDKMDNEYGGYRYSAIPVYIGDKYAKFMGA